MVVTAEANADLRSILLWTLRRFGTAQHRLYRDAVRAALGLLRDGPEPVGSRPADPANPTLRRLAIGPRGRHLLVFRQAPSGTVVVLRVLRTAMDLPRHLPERDG